MKHQTKETKNKFILAHLTDKIFIDLPDNLDVLNMAKLQRDLLAKNVKMSYVSLLQLIKGVKETVNGFSIMQVAPAQPVLHLRQEQLHKPKVFHAETNKVPKAVKRNSPQSKTLEMLRDGITLAKLKEFFQSDVCDTQLLHDIQFYANNLGYDVMYVNGTDNIQLIIPHHLDNIVYEETMH